MENELNKGDIVRFEYRRNSKDPLVGSLLKITAFLIDDDIVELEDNDIRYYVKPDQIKLWSSAENNAKVSESLKSNQWIEFDIHLIDNSLVGLGIEGKDELGKLLVRKDKICSFRYALEDDGGQDGTIIYTEDGENFWVSMSYDELKSLLCQ